MFNDTQEIINLYQSGKTQKEIATIYKCSQTYISNILIHNRIKMRIGKKITYADINAIFLKK
jgi:DNA-directed RNA polymerase specialized sigma subunit